MTEHLIFTPMLNVYATIYDEDNDLFSIEFTRYKKVKVNMDKKCIPQLIEILEDIYSKQTGIKL